MLCAAVLVALGVWQGEGYWENSDGVYALSARQLLDGQSLYEDFAAAQPPSLFYVAAGALAISDSLAAIRVEMAVCRLAVSLLVLVAVWRLTRRRDAALVAALVAFVTPWALREHAQLLPETVGAPLLMAAALAASRRATSVLAGVLGAVATTFKVAFLLPAAVIVLLGRHVRRGLVGLAVTLLAFVLTFLATFGESLWTNVVVAQAQTGRASLGYVSGLWAQGGWNALPMLVLAAIAWCRRDRLHDPDLVRSLLAACTASLLLFLTLFKQGSYLTVMVVMEPPLLSLAAGGVVVALSQGAQSGRRPRVRIATVGVAALLLTAQAVSLLLAPANPRLFIRPFAQSGPARALSSEAVRAASAAIRRCPAEASYAGPPYLAFVADHRIAGSQPDQFIIHEARALSAFRVRADTDRPLCRATAAGRR
ncbi:MAG: hypothetical protein M3401_05260 [Actinomycetota bacterium]|nr:hypothetical protein [Actinomycetota bacterium]